MIDETDAAEADGRDDVRDLVAGAAAGDEAAWRELVDRYAPRVFGLLRAQCGNADLSEELVQATFVTVAAKVGDYVESGRFESWLFRIAMNKLRDEMRRRGRQAATVDDETLGGMAPPIVEEPRAGADEIDRLRAAMAKLPEADRRVLHLRHAAGMSFKQMAELLEQPLGTVLARHHRALRKVRDILEPEPDADGAADDGEAS